MSEPTGAARRRGPFKVGDQVQLTDPKGRHYTFTLEAGKNFHTHKGSFPHDELIGAPEGSVVRTTGNVAYLALRPLLPDYVLSMPRGAAVVYPKDAGQILAMADIFPGARVVEAGVGSGSLSSFLLRAIGDQGMLHSYERREDFAEIAQQNVERYFGGPHPAWQLTVGDLQDNLSDTDVDRVILDMLAPWECLEAVSKALVPGGILCCLRRHHHAARPHRRVHPRARHLQRAAVLGDHGPHLARRGPGRPPRPPHDRPHRLPAHRPPPRRRRRAPAAPPPARQGRLRRGLHRPGQRRRRLRAAGRPRPQSTYRRRGRVPADPGTRPRRLPC